jgi:heat shock protein HslJ
MKLLAPILLLSSVLLLYGCSSSGAPDNTTLTGTEWVMFEMDGVKYEPASGKSVTMKFDGKEKNVGGKAPCNTYGGPYTKTSNKLSFGGLFSTEMACDELATEQKYFKLLETVFAYQISGDKLYFFDSGGMVIFRFRAK